MHAEYQGSGSVDIPSDALYVKRDSRHKGLYLIDLLCSLHQGDLPLFALSGT